ncbi:MAG: thioredoxin [Inquilinus sp.]|nr:thioredoxin [Inquilinus sp.]
MEPILKAAGPVPADLVKDTDTAGFAADVIEASMEAPVIVDFWAPWCGPCKTLGPMLEKAVRAARGKVRMVKLNIDENQQLATQMRIQSIPAVYAFFQGRPVDGFTGAVPESQLKSFVDKLVGLAGGPDAALAEALEHAKQALEAEDFHGAAAIYNQVLQHDPENAAAYAGLARSLIGVGEASQARQVLDSIDPAVAGKPEIVAVRRTLELAEQTAGAAGQIPALMEKLAADQNDHQARFDLAMALYGDGKREAAVDELIEIVRRDREWNEQAARKQLVTFFEAFGPTDPLTAQGRRRLSAILFS